MKTHTRPVNNRLAALLLLSLAALIGGCGPGGAPEPPSGPAAAITTDPTPVKEAPAVAVRSDGTTIDLDRIDADLAELDAHLSEADRDLATPEGDF